MPPSEAVSRPTLLNSCAKAATAAEARFRISYPFLPRDSRVIALDRPAAGIVCRLAQREWSGSARFLRFDAPDGGGNGAAPDATLQRCDGSEARLSEELADADVVVMIVGADSHDAASVIGRASAERGIMTAGAALAAGGDRVNEAVLALRPYAMVLVTSQEEEDLVELLTALRV